jgi:pSer/pThr/pTyr-binding forkhead associated (FHA) protein
MISRFALVVVQGLPREPGRVIPLGEGSQILGRTEIADIRLHVDTVSRRHARITVEGERVTLEDAWSCGGTFVNDEMVRGVVELSPGARLQLGHVILTLVRREEEG